MSNPVEEAPLAPEMTFSNVSNAYVNSNAEVEACLASRQKLGLGGHKVEHLSDVLPAGGLLPS